MGSQSAVETGELGSPLREDGSGLEWGMLSTMSSGGSLMSSSVSLITALVGSLYLIASPQVSPAYSLSYSLANLPSRARYGS